MKTSLCHLFTFLCISLLVSCSPEQIQPEPEVEAPVVAGDTYKYVILRNDGQLFEIGNITGKVTKASQIPNLEFNTVFNGITSSGTHIYIYEHEFDPFRGYLHVYNKTTKKSQAVALDLPEETFGPYPGLVSLEWNETDKTLIAIVKEDLDNSVNLTARVARIDPVTFEVTSLDTELNRGPILSTVYLDKVIYATSYRTTAGSGQNDFFAIDLATGTTNSLDFPGLELPPLRLSKGGSGNTLFGFLPVAGSNFGGAAKPTLLDLNSREITRFMQDEVVGIKINTGHSFYNTETKDHVEIISSPTYNALFMYNHETEKVTVTTLEEPNEMGSLIGIIDARKI